jgi:hypothetical protein
VTDWPTQWIQNLNGQSHKYHTTQQLIELEKPAGVPGGGCPPALASIIAAWPKLPEKIRRAILLVAGCDND